MRLSKNRRKCSALSPADRARWKGRFSAPFTFRVPLRPELVKLPGNRYRARVWTGYATPLANLHKKPIVLRRLGEGGWVTLRTARLGLVDARNFTATFTVRVSDLTLRVLLPTQSARPCYNGGASPIVRT